MRNNNRERQYTGGTVALACLFIILMRWLSPAINAGFDWIALGLAAIAAVGVLLPVFMPDKSARPANSTDLAEPNTPARSEAAHILRKRANQLGWQTPEGGVYDALIKLSRRNAYAAISGAYATMMLLLNQSDSTAEPTAAIQSLVRTKRMREPEAELLNGLIGQLDEQCSFGAAPIDEPSQTALLDAALSAVAFLERVS
ncbi:hypothetical protein AGMMS49992_14070 [Clostridia bacterium]|nr:hypothetical protein AGMMS49992_14070 [Clostridia bacterium]